MSFTHHYASHIQRLCNLYEQALSEVVGSFDAILIHSKQKVPDEIFEFCNRYSAFGRRVPLVVVPSTYNRVTEDELIERGVNVVIYANQLLRAAYPAMVEAARSILRHGRSAEADGQLMSINEILDLIPGTR